MFGWRRRSEGFEWREHVRTTVLVRRADRQRRIDDVREAAVAKVQDARDRGIEAGKAGVEAAAGVASNAAAKAGQGVLAGVVVAGRGIAAGASFVGKVAADRARAVADWMPRIEQRDGDLDDSNSGATRIEREARQAERAKRDAVRAAYEDAQQRERAPKAPRDRPKIAMPRIALPNSDGWRDAALAKVTPWLGFAGKASAAIAVIVFGGQILRSGEGSENGLSAASSVATTGSISREAAIAPVSGLSGRATATAGDRLRINGREIRLGGIAAPEVNQPCLTANSRRWNCQSSAKRALDRMLRGKSVSCVASGEDPSGITIATCTIGEDDIARALVREGHVFAANTLFSSYKSDEDPARAALKGIWQGETVHPDTWRERVWEEAKRVSPDGCPIKGVETASNRTYAMPWWSAYSGSRFRSNKSQHWFCTEDEARAAGFKPASNS